MNRINSPSQHARGTAHCTFNWNLSVRGYKHLTVWFPFAEPLPGSKSYSWLMNISYDWVVLECPWLAITLSVRWNKPNLSSNWQTCSVGTGSHSHFSSADFHLIWIFQNIDYICLFLGSSLTVNMKVLQLSKRPELFDTGRKVKT